jgi:hypothetical protein
MKLARCNAPDGQQFRAGQATLFCLLPPHDAKTPHQFATCCPTCGQTVATNVAPAVPTTADVVSTQLPKAS